MFDNFVYCYLSPTIMGLLAFIAIVLAIVGTIWFLSVLHDKYAHKFQLSRVASEIIDVSSTIALNIFLVALGLLLGALILFGAWDVGMYILKRVACL